MSHVGPWPCFCSVSAVDRGDAAIGAPKGDTGDRKRDSMDVRCSEGIPIGTGTSAARPRGGKWSKRGTAGSNVEGEERTAAVVYLP